LTGCGCDIIIIIRLSEKHQKGHAMENLTTEYKREYTDNIKKTVVAFANTAGGKILIGADDDGRPCGLEDPDGVMLRLTNAVRDAVRPDVSMFMTCSPIKRDGRTMVEAVVSRGTARPYYLREKGIRPEGVFVRQGSSTVPASDAAILNMIRETSGDRFEASRSLQQDLTFEKTSAYFREKGLAFGTPQMRSLGLTAEDGTYTGLALLLSDQCPAVIKLAAFDGSTKTVFRDRKELSGPLLSQLEEAYSYIDRYNSTRSEIAGLERIDTRDYPPEAVREALLNAVIHREYYFSAPTLISIFDDRIEFVSMGGLAAGIAMKDLDLGVSVPRNERLANVFYRLKLIEAYGTGLMKIRECYADSGVKPRVEASPNAFRLTLPNVNDPAQRDAGSAKESLEYPQAVPAQERENAVLGMLEGVPQISRKDIQRVLGISQASAILLVREMVEDGYLVKTGDGRNVRYVKGSKR